MNRFWLIENFFLYLLLQIVEILMKHCFLLIFLSVILASCMTTNTVDEAKDYAIQAIDNKDYSYAKRVCDELYSTSRNDSAPSRVQALCDLSLMYMKIADAIDYDSNIECAVKCYREAYRTDSARAAAYYDSIAVDDMAHWALMSSIVNRSLQSDELHDIDEDEMKYVNEADSTGIIP